MSIKGKENAADKGSSNPLYIALTVAAFLLALVLIFSWNDSFYYDMQAYFLDQSLTPPGSRRVSSPGKLAIDFGNGKKRTFEGEVLRGMTVLSALRAAESAGNFRVLTSDRGVVVDIAGIRQNSHRRWRILLNNLPLSELPGETAIGAGDRILFKYE